MSGREHPTSAVGEARLCRACAQRRGPLRKCCHPRASRQRIWRAPVPPSLPVSGSQPASTSPVSAMPDESKQASLLVGRNPLSRLPSGRGRRGGLRPPSIPRAGALMGRPPRAPQGASTAKVTVRLPEQVATGWRAAAAAAELTVSDWVRGQVAAARPGEHAGWVGRRPPRRRTGLGRAVAPPVDPAVVVQLARIGNNLNQIARHLNATGGPLTVAGLVTLQTIAADINGTLRAGLPARVGGTSRDSGEG